MKRFYQNIGKFIFPLLLLLVFLPVDDRLRFQELENDCFDHGSWIYDRIYLNPKAIDIAFVGSSQTINAVNDRLIENQLSGESIVNLGYCRLGRNLHFTIIKRLLEVKQPKEIILEIRQDEDRYSHDIFPFVASTKDVLTPNVLFNRDIAVDVVDHFKYKIALTADSLFKSSEIERIDTSAYGNYSSSDTMAFERLEEIRKARLENQKQLSQIQRDFHMAYPKSYLEDIYASCQRNKVKLSFVYLPQYGYHQ